VIQRGIFLGVLLRTQRGHRRHTGKQTRTVHMLQGTVGDLGDIMGYIVRDGREH
jgi:hypothetical protein